MPSESSHVVALSTLTLLYNATDRVEFIGNALSLLTKEADFFFNYIEMDKMI